MAQEGYWAVCEAMYPKGKVTGKPAAFFVQIPGFFYADAMAQTQFEAMNRAREKLYKNIGFLQRCSCDIPQPQSSAVPPEDRFPDGSVVFFISLEELEQIEQRSVKKAA